MSSDWGLILVSTIFDGHITVVHSMESVKKGVSVLKAFLYFFIWVGNMPES